VNISPASVSEVSDAGELILIGNDVANVARDIQAINPDFRLRYSDSRDISIVHQEEYHPLTGELLKKQLVTTMRGAPDQRLVERVREVTSPQYDLVAEIEKVEKAAQRALKHARREEIGEKAEKLAWALVKDTHRNQRRIFLPRGVEAS
jgi:hypothetical protein